MKRSGDATEPGEWLKPGAFSLLVHIGLVVFLLVNLKTPPMKHPISVYRVNILRLGTGTPPGGAGLAHSIPGGGSLPATLSRDPKAAEAPKKGETPVKAETPKKTEVTEASKRDRKEPARKVEPEKGKVPQTTKIPEKRDTEVKPIVGLKSSPHKEEKPKGDTSDQSLQEALAEIQRKVALDELRKRIAKRGGKEGTPAGGSSGSSPSQGSGASSSKDLSQPGSGSGSGTEQGIGAGTGSESGTGKGTGVGPGTGTGGSPWGSPQGSSDGSVLDAYYTMVWAKIKEEWTLPENLPQEKADLETIIVVIIERDGKVQKSWFEKRSGNALYDQMAMRAIKKAEPLPPIPKEFGDDTFEIGIRFYPE